MKRFLSSSAIPVILLASALFAPATLPAQMTGPGWFNISSRSVLNSVTNDQDNGGVTPLAMMAPQPDDSVQPLVVLATGSGATEATPAITELARGLGNDPLLIFEYVRNHIDYEPYFGSLKGATGTYLDGSGNDFDQASLLIALLRAGGTTAQYVYGSATLSVTNAANWLGVTNGVTDITYMLADGGMPVLDYTDSDVTLAHVWVSVSIGSDTFLLDPSYKQYAYTGGIDLPTAMGYNRTSLLQAATNGADVTADYVRNLSETGIRNELLKCATNLVSSLLSGHPNDDVSSIVAGRQIVAEQYPSLPATLPFSATQYSLWDTIPTNYVHQVRIQYGTLDATLNIPELNGAKLAVTFVANDNTPPAAPLTNVLVSEGFESGFPSGWSVGDANSSGTPAYWGSVSSGFAGVTSPSGSKMGYCAGYNYSTANGRPNYRNNMTAYMQQTVDLSGLGQAILTFKSFIPSMETVANTDSCRVRVSLNGGTSWTTLWNVSRVDSAWTSERLDLSSYVGNSSVLLRFEFVSDSSGADESWANFIGWFVDDIALVGTQGDRYDRGTGVPRDTDIAGTVVNAGDLNMYRVTLRAGGSYTISDTLGTLQFSDLTLFSPSETQLARNAPSQSGHSPSISYSCTNTAVYYVQVGGQTYSTGTYTLHVTEQTPGPVMPAILWKDGTTLLQENPLTTPHPTNLTLTVFHPYFPASYASNVNQQVVYPLVRSGKYVIVRGFGGGESGRWLRTRQRQLESYRAQNLASNSNEIVTETLNVIGQTWIEETSLARKLIDRLAGVRTITHHRFGLMAQETGFYVDVKAQVVTMTATNGNDRDATAAFKAYGLIGSAMEHAVLEQTQGTNKQSASTIKLIKLANQNGKKIYLASSSNYVARVRSALQYTSAEKIAFSNIVAAGGQLLLPETNSITLNQWKGEGYMVFSPDYGSGSSIAMIIGGNYYGGYNGSPGPVNTDNTYDNSVPYMVSSVTENHPVSVEPVDLVTGAFLSQHEDLGLGGAEPRGLHLVRTYNSDQGNQTSALGHGWTHSYDISIQTSSDYSSALGLRTPVDAAPVMVAVLATLDLAKNADNVQGWTTAVLANQWATDQITENARNVLLRDRALTFLKLPDSSFTPPPGVTTALTQSNGLYRLTERFGTQYDFGTNLHLSAWTDVDGNAMSFQYNTATNLTSVTDCFGRQLTFNYTNGLLSSVSHNGTPARTVSYTYSAAGDLTQYTDPEGNVWKQNYDSAHRIVSLVDPLSKTTIVNVFDSVGHVKSQQNGFGNTWNFYFSDYRNVEADPQGGQKVYSYDDKRRQIGSEFVAGSPSFAFYDGQDHVVATLDPLGRPTWMLYDGNQNLTNKIDALTNCTSYAYDSLNRLIAMCDPLGNLTQYGYDANHHLTNTLDAAGHTTTSSYYTSGASKGLPNTVVYPGNISASYTYTNGQVAGITSTDGGTRSMQYDIVGNQTAATDPNGRTTRFSYDKRCLPLTVIDALNNTASNVYNAAGLRIRTVDALGRTNTLAYTPTYNIASVRFPDGGMVTNVYDSRDLAVRVTDPRGNSVSNTFDVALRRVAVTDPLANRASVALDPVGNPVSATNALGLVTATTFDPLNRPVAVVDPLQRQWQTAYDARNVTTSTTDARSRVTRYATDALGRRVGVTYPSGRTEGFGFDALGRQTAFTNSEGHVYQMAYDGQNRLIAATNAAGEQVFRNFFDPCGNLTNRMDGAGRITRNQFDALNRCTNTVYADGSIEAFSFDAAGNLLTAKNAATTNTFGYDSMNRLVASTSRVAGVSFAAAYRYDLGGLATNVVYPGGNTVRYFFDADGWVTNVVDWAGHAWQMSRDAAGRMTGLTYPNGIAGSWGYDACSAVANWGYAGIAGLPGRSITRDAMSLKTREDITSGPMPVPSTNRRAVNTFNEADRLTSAQVTVGSGTFTETYLHDPCGALTNIVRSTGTNDGFSYDLAGRMLSATTSNLSLLASYDALGNRVSTTINGTNHLWVIDHSDPLKRPLMETDSNGTPVRYYIWGAGRLLGIVESDGTLRCVHSDDQGSVVALTDASGAVVFSASYGPYGEPWGTTGTNTTPFGWLGGHGVFHADSSSLYLTRNRAYDTTLKRFLQQDPTGLGGGANLYSYALGNPLSYVDALGLCGTTFEDSGNSFASGNNSVSSAQQYVSALDESGNTYLSADYSTFQPSPRAEGPNGLAAWTPVVGNYQRWDASIQNGEYGAAMFYAAMVGVDAATLGVDSLFENIGVNVAKRGSVVIGENMGRVERYASQIGAETFQGTGMEANRLWIQEARAAGKQVIDIGPDFERRLERVADGVRPDSLFYNMERMETKGYDNYLKGFDRTGKYQGTLP